MPPNEETVERAYQEKNDADLRLKESRKKGTFNLCKAWEDQYKYGHEEGRKEERKDIALRLFDLGDNIEKIGVVVEESEETVAGWLQEAGKLDSMCGQNLNQTEEGIL